jgi:hypothetical protein
MRTECQYRHRQWGPWFALLYPLSVLFVSLAVLLRDFPLWFIFLLVGMLMAPLAAGVHYLTIEDQCDHLWIHFGPLPLFSLRINYREIVSVETGRTTLLDGWGIHWSLRGGWVWNIWGRDCVVIRMRSHVIFVGTNDSDRLLRHLRSQLANLSGSGDLILG